MEMPKYAGLVRVLAQIGAALGCAIGALMIYNALGAFRFGLFPGLSASLGGVFYILASLASLGVVYCFLAMVEAQIDTRNAVVDYTARKKMQTGKTAATDPISERPEHFI